MEHWISQTWFRSFLLVYSVVKLYLRQNNGMLLRSKTKFIVKYVMLDFLHVIPFFYQAIFNGIFLSQNTPFTLRLITNINILLSHTKHEADIMRTQLTFENSLWTIIPNKPSLKKQLYEYPSTSNTMNKTEIASRLFFLTLVVVPLSITTVWISITSAML